MSTAVAWQSLMHQALTMWRRNGMNATGVLSAGLISVLFRGGKQQ